ncbi:MAG: glycoside hydrolase family 15 protein [Anaerolineales bacterium]
MSALQETSLQVILDNQSSSGAFLASPNFPTYRYAWLRDGSFCAYALDLWGQNQRADNFHAWVFAVLERYRDKLQHVLECQRQGIALPAGQYFHSRFTIEGEEIPGNWGHHQLDGLGTWLWACCRHFQAQGKVPQAKQRRSLTLARDYLLALWRQPCSDCWEEHEDQMHTYSLAAVAAGLEALGELLEDALAARAAIQIRQFILASAVEGGRLVKSLGNPQVDANLIALATPFRVAAYHSPIMQKTLERIRSQLASPEGGLKRYASDTYYGGGEWVLLAAWLGWAACEAGDRQTAGRQLAWVAAQADAHGYLPEQVSRHLNAPAYYDEWVARWGAVASPLLWSHAQYLILLKAVERSAAAGSQTADKIGKTRQA